MLIALLTYLLLGGGNATQLLGDLGGVSDRVEIVMPAGDQRTEALSALKEMEKKTKARNKQVRTLVKKMDAAVSDHDISDVSMDAIWVDYLQGVDEFHRDMIGSRSELKRHVSREEWEAIFLADDPSD